MIQPVTLLEKTACIKFVQLKTYTNAFRCGRHDWIESTE